MSDPAKNLNTVDDMPRIALYVMHNGWKAVKGATGPDETYPSGIGGAAQNYSKFCGKNGAGRHDRHAADGVVNRLCCEGRRH